MNIIECPKCTLRFEPDNTRFDTGADVFCPQCGNKFVAVRENETESGSASASAQAA